MGGRANTCTQPYTSMRVYGADTPLRYTLFTEWVEKTGRLKQLASAGAVVLLAWLGGVDPADLGQQFQR